MEGRSGVRKAAVRTPQVGEGQVAIRTAGRMERAPASYGSVRVLRLPTGPTDPSGRRSRGGRRGRREE